jgi:hypothetical protein
MPLRDQSERLVMLDRQVDDKSRALPGGGAHQLRYCEPMEALGGVVKQLQAQSSA